MARDRDFPRLVEEAVEDVRRDFPRVILTINMARWVDDDSIEVRAVHPSGRSGEFYLDPSMFDRRSSYTVYGTLKAIVGRIESGSL